MYGGHELTIELSDPMAEGWYDRDGPSPVGTALLREREVLKPGARVFNFGAHQGLVALIFAREVGPSGQVVAIEAVRHNARAAETNRVLNAASNMHVLHAAGAAAEGMIPFTESFNGRADEHGLTSIQARSVDGLARAYGDPDVVFVDVEGYEEQVLRGAAATLANRRTAFVVEVHKPETLARYGATVEDVFGYFTKGFDVFVTLGDQMPLAPAHALEGRGFLVALPAASDLAG
ncbi:MAG: hypothetical protein QOF54_2279 [Solirubrobacteraceae bacterium]|nr:hypothetical protein [Solirubrobacteraceae bacterium]